MLCRYVHRSLPQLFPSSHALIAHKLLLSKWLLLVVCVEIAFIVALQE